MSVRKNAGRTKLIYLPKTSAIAVAAGEFMKTNSSGGILPCISDTNELIVGVSRDSHAATDTAVSMAVEVPLENYVEFEIDTDSDGGAADSDVGGYRDLDTTGGNIDMSSSVDKVLLVLRVISATKVVATLAKSAVNSFNPSAVISS